MIAAYLRVSSQAQDLATQRHAIGQVCRAKHICINKWFEEKCSGNATERPELARLKNSVRAGLVTEVYVYRLDRLTRGTICEVLNLLQDFEAHGCRIVSVGDSFPMEGPFREVVLAMIAWGAWMERQIIADRVAAARARVEAAGGTWGHPRQLPDATWRRILELKGEGRSIRSISKALKIPRSTVMRWAARPRAPGLM